MSSTPDDLHVLMAPDFRADNPYQSLLVRNLEHCGVRVTFPQGYRRGLPLLREAREHGADVLHLHWLTPYLRGTTTPTRILYFFKLLVDLLLVRKSGTRVVWTIHDLMNHESSFPKLEMWLRRRIARLSSRVLVHSEAAKKEVIGEYGISAARIAVVRHGHFRDIYSEAPDRDSARRMLGLPSAGRLFLLFGMLRPYKGIEDLLEIWPDYHRDHPDDRLWIVGKALDDAYLALLEQKRQPLDGVMLTHTFVADNMVPVYFGAADVAVLPFRKTLTSGSLLLAMMFGTPVIAPSIPVVREATDNASDLLFDTLDSGGLLKALQRVDQFDLAELSERTLRACDRLDWPEIARTTAHVYRNAVNGPSRPVPVRSYATTEVPV